jgi:hypothetical protein
MAGKGVLVVDDGATPVSVSSEADLRAIAVGNLSKASAEAGSSSGTTAIGGEAVVDMMQRLNLTSKEATPLILEDEGDADLQGPEWALSGKVLGPNLLHVETIRAVVRPAWGNPKGLIVRPMGPNLFMAEFSSEVDMDRVAKGGPWRLGKQAILLKRYDVRIKPEDVVFDELMIWARILNLGFELMNAERGTSLAACLGKVDRLDVDENGKAWGSYLRARVTINATEPIMRCISVFSKKKNTMMHFDVMYERLPLYCFSCGLLGHSSIACPNPADRDAEGNLPYHGDRLCVPEKKKKKSSPSPMDQLHSSSSSRTDTEIGSGSNTPGGTTGRRNIPDDAVPKPPVKKTTRARKPPVPRKKPDVVPGAGLQAVSPTKPGSKRKNKQAYRPKVPQVAAEGALVPVEVPSNAGLGDHVVIESGATLPDDSNKKQRTITPRSADPAEAAEQPRHPQ